jgi:hypothetical protein
VAFATYNKDNKINFLKNIFGLLIFFKNNIIRAYNFIEVAMKKISLLLLCFCIAVMLTSCKEDSPTSPTKTSFWKHTATEISWSYEINSTEQSGSRTPMEQIASIPFGISSTVVRTGYSTIHFSLYGSDYNISCTQQYEGSATIDSTNFAWDVLPAKMLADTLYTIAAETKGAGNMMHMSNPGLYTEALVDWVVYAYRNTGKISAKVKISKPSNLNSPDKMFIKASIASSYANIEYKYIYEWVTE